MLPRGERRVVLEDSDVEEYKRKSSVGHWVLVKESGERGRKPDGNGRQSSGEDDDYRGRRRRSYDEWSAGGIPRPGRRFTADNVRSELRSAERFLDVSCGGYAHVDGERFAGDPFDRVSAVVADDNRLRLATFRTFKSVRTLSLRRNRLESVEPIDGDLAATLTDLDVSENRLSPDDLCRLSALKLERLAVSANNLSALPDRITGCRSFLSLGSLDLSDNCLRRPKAFYVLSTLHGLRTLNMSGNRISFVPYLVTKRSSAAAVDGRASGKGQQQGHREDRATSGHDDEEEEEEEDEVVYHVRHIPFVSLNTVDLSNNRIARSGSVLSVICWPSLATVTLTANTVGLNKNATEFENLKFALSAYNVRVER